MKRLGFIVGLLLALCVQAQAQFTGGTSLGAPGFAIASGPPPFGSCSQSTTFIARTSGLSGTEKTAIDTMICGMVTDSTFSLLDGLYIFATNTTTTANLNIISTSFGLTQTGTVTFVADQGYTSNGSTGFLSTGYTPASSGGHYSLNSGTVGAYVLGSRSTTANTTAIGVAGASNGNAYYKPLSSASHASTELNGVTFPSSALLANTAAGFGSVTRTSSSGIAAYKNGSSTVLACATCAADASSTMASVPIYILAFNSNGTATLFLTDQVAAAYFGGGITGAQHLLLSNRINAYMTALGINVY